MPDKRTQELNTMEVTVALTAASIPVDTTALQAANGEQQKVLINTLLTTFAGIGTDFNINALTVSKVFTSNNDNGDVMILDGLNQVRVRSIAALIEGTQAAKSNYLFIDNPVTESYIQTGETQSVINEQNATKINSIQEQIDNIATVGATGTIIPSGMPFELPQAATVLDITTLFPSNNTSVLDFDDISNEILFNVDGIFDTNTYLEIENTVNGDETVYLVLRDKVTLAVLGQSTIEVPGNTIWSGTWVNRFNIVGAPIRAEITIYATDDNVNLTGGQSNITSIATALELNLYPKKSENETITGQWTFTDTLTANRYQSTTNYIRIGPGTTDGIIEFRPNGVNSDTNISQFKLDFAYIQPKLTIGSTTEAFEVLSVYGGNTAVVTTGLVISPTLLNAFQFKVNTFAVAEIRGFAVNNNSGNIYFNTAKTGTISTKMILNEDGWLGIDTDPLAMFHITGDAIIQGTIDCSNIDCGGNVAGGVFIGDGSQLTNLNVVPFFWAANLDGSTGGKTTEKGQPGINSIRTGTGVYQITHNIGSLGYWVSATVADSSVDTDSTIVVTKTANQVVIYTENAGALADRDIDIIIFT